MKPKDHLAHAYVVTPLRNPTLYIDAADHLGTFSLVPDSEFRKCIRWIGASRRPGHEPITTFKCQRHPVLGTL